MAPVCPAQRRFPEADTLGPGRQPAQALAYPILYLRKRTYRYCPAKSKVGRNWLEWTGLALVLGRWAFIFIFKGTPS
jgi:hypothetical protein